MVNAALLHLLPCERLREDHMGLVVTGILFVKERDAAHGLHPRRHEFTNAILEVSNGAAGDDFVCVAHWCYHWFGPLSFFVCTCGAIVRLPRQFDASRSEAYGELFVTNSTAPSILPL
jgi:hypothetical protein